MRIFYPLFTTVLSIICATLFSKMFGNIHVFYGAMLGFIMLALSIIRWEIYEQNKKRDND